MMIFYSKKEVYVFYIFLYSCEEATLAIKEDGNFYVSIGINNYANTFAGTYSIVITVKLYLRM
ncbi:hypothetical protein HMPREF1651_02330 [Prevotella bivia DNF00188]|nr:hypothetical protein HMPREF1651_02330 [Prevotella bivia DNF00188]